MKGGDDDMKKNIIDKRLQDRFSKWLWENRLSVQDVFVEMNNEVSASSLRNWKASGYVSMDTVRIFLKYHPELNKKEWLKPFADELKELVA